MDETRPTEAPPRLGVPRWVGRAIVLFWVGLVFVYYGRGLVHALRGLFVTLLVSLFLSFAIEPAVNRLARRGWRRGAATGLVFLVTLVATGLFAFAMGSLVVNQVRNFIDQAPGYVRDIEEWVNDRFDTEVDLEDLVTELEDPEGPTRQFAQDLAGKTLELSVKALGVVFQVFTVALFTFYLVADGPRLRRTICSLLPPERQRDVLRTWEMAITKTGDYLYSRVLLAGISALAHWIALSIIDVPYALALALWVGITSQFIPVVGTYLAGVLAVLIALLNDPVDGLLTVAVVVVYQQVENYLLAPRVTAQTLSMHPALAFGAVIAGASILGPVGALLALPAAAVVQAFASTIGERHEVVESALTESRPGGRRGTRRQPPEDG